VSNGTLAERHVHASRTTWIHDQPEPMASYLATVQIGRYRPVTVASSPVPQYAAIPARLRENFELDFGRQPEMMAVFERLFGPYPFRSYGVVVTDDPLEIPLEAQGLSVFGANHADGNGTWERLIAHELAHQWFGNSLTVARWRDVWLHEGFACYAEWLWSENSGGPSAEDQARAAWRRLRSLRQDLVIADPGPERMFDDRLYKRGALTLHALRHLLGDDRFFDALRSWVAGHRYASVSTEGFTDLMARTDPDAVAVLDAWLHAPRLPAFPGTA
jgi:aminopeptidase